MLVKVISCSGNMIRWANDHIGEIVNVEEFDYTNSGDYYYVKHHKDYVLRKDCVLIEIVRNEVIDEILT
jgi:hypothetical protein